jgi:O-antigen ligase
MSYKLSHSLKSMSVYRLLLLPVIMYMVLATGLFLSVADLAMGRKGLFPIPPTISAMLLLSPMCLYVIYGELMRRPSGERIIAIFVSNWSVLFCFSFIVALSLLLSGHPTAYWGDRSKWIFLISYGFLVFLISLLLPLIDLFRDYFRLTAFLALLSLVISMSVDVYNPGYFSAELSRAAGFAGNSNFASIVAVMLCSSILYYSIDRAPFFDLTVIGVAGIGMIMTQSRSGILELLVLFVFYLYVNLIQRGMSGKRVCIFALGTLGLSLVFMLVVPFLFSNSAMFQQYNTRLSHVMSSKQIDDGSSASRLAAVKDSIRLIEESTLIGHGTAHSRLMDELPHNLYLQQWVNNGLPGVASYILLLVCAWAVFRKRKFFAGQAFILVTAVGSCFSHNILDQRPFLMLLGILLTMSLYVSGRLEGKISGYN